MITAQEFREAASTAARWYKQGCGTVDAGSIDAFIGTVGRLLLAAAEQREALDVMRAERNHALSRMEQLDEVKSSWMPEELVRLVATIRDLELQLRIEIDNAQRAEKQVATLTEERDQLRRTLRDEMQKLAGYALTGARIDPLTFAYWWDGVMKILEAPPKTETP